VTYRDTLRLPVAGEKFPLARIDFEDRCRLARGAGNQHYACSQNNQVSDQQIHRRGRIE